MKTLMLILSLFLATNSFAAKVNAPAPDFTGKDINGNAISLDKLKGNYVVLEWHNKDCPYVKAQYSSGNMQTLQKQWTAKGVKWLAVVSSAAGKQGYVNAGSAAADISSTGAAPTAMILDSAGTIGHLYGAETTPHMFVIDPKGTLIYNGAIDSNPTTDKSEVATSINYVSEALTESMAGKTVSHPTSKPYGCSVKYE